MSEAGRLNRVIKPMGFEYRRGRKHAAIIRLSDGKRILTCSSTPSDRYWWSNVMKDLVRYGHVTDEVQKNALKSAAR